MRTIKFRAWDKQKERMIIDEQEFFPLKVTNKGVLRLSPNHVEDLWYFANDDRFEIMQYTGLKDKNDTEIYEWDFVKAEGMFPCKVVFENGSFRFDGGQEAIIQDYEYYSNFEVIGNVFENPEIKTK